MAHKDAFDEIGFNVGDKVIPDILFIGRERNNWPIVCFQEDGHAKRWLEDGANSAQAEGLSHNKRRLFKVDMTRVDVEEMVLVPPTDSRLVTKAPREITEEEK